MAAASHSFTIEQGTTHNEVFIWRDASQVPIDLTGYTARCQIRESKDAGTTLDNLTTENGRITIEAATGKITLVWQPADTEGATWTSGLYDVEVASSGGVVTRLVQGRITLDPEVTR